MKILFSIALFVSGITALAQQVQTDSLGFQTFQYPEGDTTYTMKQYFMVFLTPVQNKF